MIKVGAFSKVTSRFQKAAKVTRPTSEGLNIAVGNAKREVPEITSVKRALPAGDTVELNKAKKENNKVVACGSETAAECGPEWIN